MSEPEAAFGRSSGTDFDTISFAVTMKMMRSTRTMSTSGVTLIPVIASSVSRAFPPPAPISVLVRVLRGARRWGCFARSLGARCRRLECLFDVRRARARCLQMGEEHVAERLGVRERRSNDALERVERGDGGDGDEETDRRCDEGFGDVAHDRFRRDLRGGGHRRVLRFTELVERANDADDGSEKTDEGCVVAERAQEVQSLLELQ